MTVKSAKKVKNAPAIGVLSIVTSVLLSYLITLIMLVALAAAITYSDFPDSYSSTAILIITLVNVAIVGMTVARNMRTNGWLWGGAAGLCYMLLLYVIGSVISGDFSVAGSFALLVIIAVVIGAVGGIIGINTKKR